MRPGSYTISFPQTEDHKGMRTSARHRETGTILWRLRPSLACVREGPGKVDRLLARRQRVWET
jgi:hypothetical protein